MTPAATLLQLVSAPIVSADGGAMPAQDEDAAAVFTGLVAQMMAPATETETATAAPQAAQTERTPEPLASAAVTTQMIAPQVEAEPPVTTEAARAVPAPAAAIVSAPVVTPQVAPETTPAVHVALPRVEKPAVVATATAAPETAPAIDAAGPRVEPSAAAAVATATVTPQVETEQADQPEAAPRSVEAMAQPAAAAPARPRRPEANLPAKAPAEPDEPASAAPDPTVAAAAAAIVAPPMAGQSIAPKSPEAAVATTAPTVPPEAPAMIKAAAPSPEPSDSQGNEAAPAEHDATTSAERTGTPQPAKTPGVDFIKSKLPATVTSALPETAAPETVKTDTAKADTARPAATAQPFSLQPVTPDAPAAPYTPAATVAMPATHQTPEQAPAQAPAQPGAQGSTLSHAAVEQMTQVSVAIQKRLGNGTTKFQLELKPVDLGRIDVALTITAQGKVSAHLAFDTPVTATTFAARESELRQQLTAAGLKLDDDALTFSSRPAESVQNQTTPAQAQAGTFAAFTDPHTGQQPRSNPRQATRALKRADANAAEADLDAALAQLRQRPGSGRLALDLTV
ncbi:hypothetical protein ABAC460_05760 [Asticcacaulis sp. AC460]|uniref:flagellar hook-length control protein FliK n=1 Tax=Asticcacaulis sp. AC460 TaxID=1282360 RepID=UPI0003C3B424|nr:flagellar hook-length control protein FliK [Asticcacaulis sp. AC460]ESQ91489.1 hypothetical protein ABAC460_05760 [Asticcacaulis sp. AC460]